MALPWIIALAVVGLLAGPRIRAVVFARSTEAGQPPRGECPACAAQILPDRWRWRSVLPVTGRCPACRIRIGPYPLAAEAAAGVALAVAAARATSAWELAALAWLIMLSVPLAFIDLAVHRLPDPLTATAFAGTLALLTVAAHGLRQRRVGGQRREQAGRPLAGGRPAQQLAPGPGPVASAGIRGEQAGGQVKLRPHVLPTQVLALSRPGPGRASRTDATAPVPPAFPRGRPRRPAAPRSTPAARPARQGRTRHSASPAAQQHQEYFPLPMRCTICTRHGKIIPPRGFFDQKTRTVRIGICRPRPFCPWSA